MIPERIKIISANKTCLINFYFALYEKISLSIKVSNMVIVVLAFKHNLKYKMPPLYNIENPYEIF